METHYHRKRRNAQWDANTGFRLPARQAKSFLLSCILLAKYLIDVCFDCLELLFAEFH